ncbi:hypothetical protein ACGFWE_29845 [Streptomyces sp. NPDC048523]|uniref:hypothetical protein n=1 Tax=Streptomyces sp. NPDC048523 TaxID=3365567 RepID=UPI00371D4805
MPSNSGDLAAVAEAAAGIPGRLAVLADHTTGRRTPARGLPLPGAPASALEALHGRGADRGERLDRVAP